VLPTEQRGVRCELSRVMLSSGGSPCCLGRGHHESFDEVDGAVGGGVVPRCRFGRDWPGGPHSPGHRRTHLPTGAPPTTPMSTGPSTRVRHKVHGVAAFTRRPCRRICPRHAGLGRGVREKNKNSGLGARPRTALCGSNDPREVESGAPNPGCRCLKKVTYGADVTAVAPRLLPFLDRSALKIVIAAICVLPLTAGHSGTARVYRDIERAAARVSPGDIVCASRLDFGRITADASRGRRLRGRQCIAVDLRPLTHRGPRFSSATASR